MARSAPSPAAVGCSPAAQTAGGQLPRRPARCLTGGLSTVSSDAPASPASRSCAPSASSVLAHSRVCDTDGSCRRSSCRSEATNAAICPARCSENAREPWSAGCPAPVGRRVVEVQVQAPAPQRLGQVSRSVRGQEDHGHLGAGHRAELGNRDLVIGQDLEQQRLGLDVEPVNLVDQQHHRLGRPDGRQQRPGQQELLGEDAHVRPVPRPGSPGRPAAGAAAWSGSTRTAPWPRPGPRSTAA